MTKEGFEKAKEIRLQIDDRKSILSKFEHFRECIDKSERLRLEGTRSEPYISLKGKVNGGTGQVGNIKAELDRFLMMYEINLIQEIEKLEKEFEEVN